MDIVGGTALPNCPFSNSPGNGQYHNPTVSTTYYLFFLIFFTLGLMTFVKFNAVRIFNRSISHPSVNNVEYAIGFIIVSFSFAVDAIRYTIDLPHQTQDLNSTIITIYTAGEEKWIVGPQVMDSWLLVTSVILRSASVFCFSLALNQQRTHRSLPGMF